MVEEVEVAVAEGRPMGMPSGRWVLSGVISNRVVVIVASVGP
ncbi:hypothetical protein ACFQ0M_04690 [Kitasatospora aburaviensis]